MVSEEATPARFTRVLPHFKYNVKRPDIVVCGVPFGALSFVHFFLVAGCHVYMNATIRFWPSLGYSIHSLDGYRQASILKV